MQMCWLVGLMGPACCTKLAMAAIAHALVATRYIDANPFGWDQPGHRNTTLLASLEDFVVDSDAHGIDLQVRAPPRCACVPMLLVRNTDW
eukprot:SAG11_NODE_829_length_6967_cov_7.039196_2_plen_90_part_00